MFRKGAWDCCRGHLEINMAESLVKDLSLEKIDITLTENDIPGAKLVKSVEDCSCVV